MFDKIKSIVEEAVMKFGDVCDCFENVVDCNFVVGWNIDKVLDLNVGVGAIDVCLGDKVVVFGFVVDCVVVDCVVVDFVVVDFVVVDFVVVVVIVVVVWHGVLKATGGFVEFHCNTLSLSKIFALPSKLITNE